MMQIPAKVQKENPKIDQDSSLAKLGIKEVLDKIGFGFTSQQFINILFLQIGASLFLVGLINGLRVILGNLAYIVMEKFSYTKANTKIIGLSGIIFGFSFLLISVAIFLKSTALFSLAVIISSIAIVLYGESKNIFRISGSKAYLVEKIIEYSLIITGISLFIAAYMMDNYPHYGIPAIFNIFGKLFSFKIYGYLIVFEIAAISFILAGYILAKLKSGSSLANKAAANFEMSNFKFFIKNRMLLLLMITNIVIGIVQTAGYSYYGIFIYQNFNNVLFGGFLNVAMVFLISVFTSLIGYFITKINSRVYKKFPILIFGVVMLAFMPLSFFFTPNLIFITVGTIMGVIGSSVVGVTNSMLAIDLISHELRQAYFSFINLASIPFLLVIVPVLSYVAQAYSLSALFISLAVILSVLLIVLLAASKIFINKLT